MIRSIQKARGLPPNEALLEEAMECFLEAQRLAPQNLYHQLYIRTVDAICRVPSPPPNGYERLVWPSPLLQLYNGDISEDQLFAYLQKHVQADHLSEAHYFVALLGLARSQPDFAKRHLRCCMRYKSEHARISAVLLHSLI